MTATEGARMGTGMTGDSYGDGHDSDGAEYASAAAIILSVSRHSVAGSESARVHGPGPRALRVRGQAQWLARPR